MDKEDIPPVEIHIDGPIYIDGEIQPFKRMEELLDEILAQATITNSLLRRLLNKL